MSDWEATARELLADQEALRADLARATEEYVELLRRVLEMTSERDDYRSAFSAATARADDLARQLAEARKALKPFARAASSFQFVIAAGGIDDALHITARADVDHLRQVRLTTRDFSQAARALATSRDAADGAPISDAQGVEWFERTFGVPIGDKPGRLDVDAVLQRIAPPAPDSEAGR